jgi:NAD(P)-dependent dehydrogenase (short-subunit alcohol dehydrogenase family)
MSSATPPQPPAATAQQVLAFLEAALKDPALLARLPSDERRRLVEAAGRLARPDAATKRAFRREQKRHKREGERRAAERVLDSTGIRKLRALPVFPSLPHLPPLPAGEDPDTALAATPRIPASPAAAGPAIERTCYICKVDYREIHHFYDSLCPPCAEFNWQKRHPVGDLRGRVALVTGARVKIGYQITLYLLRAGCRVVATTRFARDAASRYAKEPDFAAFRDRLQVVGLDLRHTPSVESLARHLEASLDRLDFLINNACQTVRRPSGFYAHLMDAERQREEAMPGPVHNLLQCHREWQHSALPVAQDQRGRWLQHDAAELSQRVLLADDLLQGESIFPSGRLDQDLQQVDLRGINSWRLGLAEVPTMELLEVQLVNAVAPFVLNARLKPLMLRTPTRDKHIVNVSAMEGQFYRSFKTDKHPHTNMAKAALNMMTRTSARDYQRDGIHMNSVDTGWVTDEDPREIALRKTAEHGFHPPLDIMDGAARVVDPIFDGLQTGVHVWGQFLKDYKPTHW